jgi:hypothetical protein
LTDILAAFSSWRKQRTDRFMSSRCRFAQVCLLNNVYVQG